MNVFWLLRLGLFVACAARRPPAPAPVEAAPPPSEVGPSEAARAWYLRAQVAEARGDAVEAERALRWLLRLEPEDVNAHAAWASWLERQNRLEEAEAAWQRAHAIDPTHPRVQHGLGAILLRRGRPEAAEPLLVAACGRSPGACEALTRLNHQTDTPNLAHEALSLWLREAPVSAEERLRRAQVADRLQRFEDSFEDALAAADDGVDPVWAIQLAARAADQTCDREALWRWAIATRPLDAPGEDAARIALRIGRSAGDWALVEAASARLGGANDPELSLAWARARAAGGAPAEAAALLDDALLAWPEDGRLAVARGEVALMVGDKTGALAQWRRVSGPRAAEAAAWIALTEGADLISVPEGPWRERVTCARGREPLACLAAAAAKAPELIPTLLAAIPQGPPTDHAAGVALAEAVTVAARLAPCAPEPRVATLWLAGCEADPRPVYAAAPADRAVLAQVAGWRAACGIPDEALARRIALSERSLP